VKTERVAEIVQRLKKKIIVAS